MKLLAVGPLTQPAGHHMPDAPDGDGPPQHDHAETDAMDHDAMDHQTDMTPTDASVARRPRTPRPTAATSTDRATASSGKTTWWRSTG